MTRRKQTKQLNEGKMPLPGSRKRIEKALTLPTTGKPNPFLNRLDPALAKPPPKPSSETPPKPASNQPAKSPKE